MPRSTGVLQVRGGAVDVLIVHFKSRRRPVTLGVTIAAVAAGVAIIATGMHAGWAGLHGIRLLAFLVGAVAFATAVYLFQRALRRRSRLEAIADLLPSYRHYQRADDEFLFDEPDLDDDQSSRLPMRSELRAATRALLVSLEDEMRREVGRARRSGRPGCRHARLRAAGRSEPRRRRVPLRLATVPS